MLSKGFNQESVITGTKKIGTTSLYRLGTKFLVNHNTNSVGDQVSFSSEGQP